MKRLLPALLFISFFGTSEVFAQNGPSYLYNIQVGPLDESSDQKVVIELINSFDNDMSISYSEAVEEFKVASYVFLNISQLQSVLNTAGYHLGEVTVQNLHLNSENRLPDSMPEMGDSGNTEQDQFEYRQAKQQWVQEHTDEYNAQFEPKIRTMSQKEFNALELEEQVRLLDQGAVTITQ